MGGLERAGGWEGCKEFLRVGWVVGGWVGCRGLGGL